jgi:hypothetical protein
MTEIPDLGAIADSDPKDRRGSNSPVTKSKRNPQESLEPIDLSQVNTKDNKFIWVALIVLSLTLGGLIWFGI